MSQYYYLMASLPYLTYNQKPDYSVKEFQEMCEFHLSGSDLECFKEANYKNLDKETGSGSFIEKWKKWEISLRNELVRQRSRKKGIDGTPYLKAIDEDFDALVQVSSFIEEESPIKAEEALNQWRWNYLETLEVGHFFDLEKLIIYYLKLQILERKFSFDEEQGKTIFDKNMEYYNNSLNAWEKSYGN